MSIREFTSRSGVPWRAWNITPEKIHPVTKAEDYLADCYELGWIVFETKSGDQKRRLCPYPSDWLDLSDAALEQLLESATPISPRKLAKERESAGERIVPSTMDAPTTHSEDESPDVTDLGVVRSFRYPGGRLWTVCVMPHSVAGGPPVLRFSAGARVVEMHSWPKDWADYLDDRLVEMLRRAAPRIRPSSPDANVPRRRYDDPRA
jgi:hypothetical protein